MSAKKTALVTGANKGIGLEAARLLGKQGFTVFVGARDHSKGAAAAEDMKKDGIDARVVVLDVSNDASVQAAAGAVHKDVGKLDVLVNNAGINLEFGTAIPAPSAISLEIIQQTYDTNVYGPIRTIQAFLPLLQAAKGARIINVSSTLGSLTSLTDPKHGFYGMNIPAYDTSKTALNGWTVAFAKELAPHGITVNSVCPGWVKTDMGGNDAPRNVAQGASIIVKLATMDDPPNAAFMDENGAVAW